MSIKHIIIYAYFYLSSFSLFIFSQNITVESDDIPYEYIYHFDEIKYDSSTSECSIDNVYVCKDKICVCISGYINKPFIEFPDKNGSIHNYILVPYTDINNNFIYNDDNSTNNETIYVSTNCKTDLQCFSNKCIANECTYNVDSNISRCDYVYVKPSVFSKQKHHHHCGRMLGEKCTKHVDCSFEQCDNGICSMNYYVPSESDNLTIGFIKLGYIGGLIIILLIIICCCCCYCYIKRHKQNINKFFNEDNNFEYFK
jgi:hypothetical protein